MADRLDAICGIKSRNGKTYWTKVGVAFPSRQGNGYSLFLDYIPVTRNEDGKIAILLAEPREDGERGRGRSRDDDDGEERRPPRGEKKQDPMDDDIPF